MSPWNPAIWISQNWMYLAGWLTLCVFLYKVYGIFNKLGSYGSAITTLQADMEIMKINHLPHVQAELVAVNTNITGLRADLKEGFTRLENSLNVVLTKII